MSPFMNIHNNPHPPDQHTPSPTPPPHQGGEAGEPGVAEGKLAQVDPTYHAAFEVGNMWSMPRNNTYEHTLYGLMTFAHNCDFAATQRAPSLQGSGFCSSNRSISITGWQRRLLERWSTPSKAGTGPSMLGHPPSSSTKRL